MQSRFDRGSNRFGMWAVALAGLLLGVAGCSPDESASGGEDAGIIDGEFVVPDAEIPEIPCWGNPAKCSDAGTSPDVEQSMPTYYRAQLSGALVVPATEGTTSFHGSAAVVLDGAKSSLSIQVTHNVPSGSVLVRGGRVSEADGETFTIACRAVDVEVHAGRRAASATAGRASSRRRVRMVAPIRGSAGRRSAGRLVRGVQGP